MTSAAAGGTLPPDMIPIYELRRRSDREDQWQNRFLCSTIFISAYDRRNPQTPEEHYTFSPFHRGWRGSASRMSYERASSVITIEDITVEELLTATSEFLTELRAFTENKTP